MGDCYNHLAGKELTLENLQKIKYMGGYNNDWDLLGYLFKQENLDIKLEQLQEYYSKHYCNEKFEGYINDENLIIDKNYI